MDNGNKIVGKNEVETGEKKHIHHWQNDLADSLDDEKQNKNPV